MYTCEGGTLRLWIAGICLALLQAGTVREEQSNAFRIAPVEGRRLALLQDAVELTSISIPSDVSASSIEDGIQKTLRDSGGAALAVSIRRARQSFIVVFMRIESGQWTAVDISPIERMNIGVIGPDRAYQNFETEPVEWQHWPGGIPDDRLVIVVRTRVWDTAGKRYTMQQPLIMMPDGSPAWR